MIRIGIVGCGEIAKSKHIRALRQFPDRCEVTALLSAHPESARQVQREMLPHALVYESMEDLLSRGGIDAVHICTPNSSHCALTLQALAAGKHVMCEKPMAETYADACRMIEAAHRSGKSLSVSYQNRFRDDSLALYEARRAGDLGEIYFARAHATRWKKVPTWGRFLSHAAQGGGALMDIGTHAIDLALWLMDNYELESVSAATFQGLTHEPMGNAWGTWDPAQFEVEDSAFGFLHMKNGAVLDVEASWALHLPDAREACVTLCGTRGGAQQLRDADGDYTWQMASAHYGQLTKLTPHLQIRRDPAVLEMDSWLAELEGCGNHLVRPEQAAEVVHVIELMYRSAETRRPILLSE